MYNKLGGNVQHQTLVRLYWISPLVRNHADCLYVDDALSDRGPLLSRDKLAIRATSLNGQTVTDNRVADSVRRTPMDLYMSSRVG